MMTRYVAPCDCRAFAQVEAISGSATPFLLNLRGLNCNFPEIGPPG